VHLIDAPARWRRCGDDVQQVCRAIQARQKHPKRMKAAGFALSKVDELTKSRAPQPVLSNLAAPADVWCLAELEQFCGVLFRLGTDTT
jgi:hypothetical protein